MKIANLELDKQERPLFPPKITSARIIENPFTDIVPRITAEEKRQQLAARQAANAERERLEKRKGAKKSVSLRGFAVPQRLELKQSRSYRNTGLLSFGDEEDKDSGVLAGGKKKVMARPDCESHPISTNAEPDADSFFFEQSLILMEALPRGDPLRLTSSCRSRFGISERNRSN